jgi:hypothetical protein
MSSIGLTPKLILLNLVYTISTPNDIFGIGKAIVSWSHDMIGLKYFVLVVIVVS